MKRFLAASLLALVCSFALSAQDQAPEPKPAKKAFIPTEDELTPLILEVLRSYPTDGTHRYHWPRASSWTGTTRDLFYDGVRVCDGDPEKRCYCCGLTWEVFFRAWELAAKKAKVEFRIGDLDAKGVTRLRRDWFGIDANDVKTLQRALVESKLGRAIELDRARPGDFVQLWRADKSGHSVVFLGLEKDAEGRPAALRYWSTQPSTDGIGERTEKFQTEQNKGKHAVLLDKTWVARAGRRSFK